MAYYGINELTQSGVTASLVQAGGFARSTVFGTSSAHTHQFSGSVYISGNLRAWTYKVDEVVSGSTIFGNDASDTHQFTGSVSTTGSEFAVWTDTGPPATPNFDVGYTWGPGSTTIANASSSISLGYAGQQNLIYITDQEAVLAMGQGAGVSGTILLADGNAAAIGVGVDTAYNKSPGVLSLAATNTLISSSLSTQFTGSVRASGSLYVTGGMEIMLESDDIFLNAPATYITDLSASLSLGGGAAQMFTQGASASLHVGTYGQGTILATDVLPAFPPPPGVTWGLGLNSSNVATPGVFAIGDNTGSFHFGADTLGTAAPGMLSFQGPDFHIQGSTGSIYQYDNPPFTFLIIDGAAAPVMAQSEDSVILQDDEGSLTVVNGGVSINAANYTRWPNINFEVHYTGSRNPVNLTADTGGGEVVYFGITATTTTPGHLHYLNENGKWELANANATGSSGETGAGNAGLLAIAMGTDPEADGMLTRGYYNLPAGAGGVMQSTWVTGSAVYVYSGSAGDAGKYTCVAPDAADSYTRIIGYCTTTEQVIHFNPGSSWIENGP